MANRFDYGKITCPHCFAEFFQNEVLFRASKGFSAHELRSDDDEDFGGLLSSFKAAESNDDDVRNLFRKFDMPDSTSDSSSNLKIDEKLVKYWSERGGARGYTEYDKYWDHPHIDPKDSNTFWKMIKTEPVGGVPVDDDGFVRDPDGFIKRVFDLYCDAGHGTTMDRLCPECHNPLPLATYGKYPVKFIGVIGMTSAGKTVFLNQLLNNIATVIAGSDYIVGSDNLNEFGDRIRRYAPLPGSTDSKIVRRPLAVDLLTKDPNNRANSMTLVFYDIAGELCVNKDGDRELQKAQSTIGKHIARCDAFIFLIDPNQVPAFAEEESSDPISNVMSVVNAIRTGVDVAVSRPMDEVPVAICVAKSDKLRNHPAVPSDLPAFVNPNNQFEGFDRNNNRLIHDFLRNLLRDSSPNIYEELRGFPQRAYFMVSAINCGVESRVEKFRNWYIFDEFNEKRYRNLHNWCKGWNERTPEDRKHYVACSVRQKDGSPITFDPNEAITEKNADKIVTEIECATNYGDCINLTMWDVANKLNLVGFPKGDPTYYRICEPVRWILWRMRLIEPCPVWQAPERKPLEPNWLYQRRYEKELAEHEEWIRRFYWMDEESL